MAEINVVEKKTNIWPWIIGLLLLLLLLWGLVEMMDNDDDVRQIPAETGISEPATTAPEQ
jgi:hypothetical protein